MIYFNVLNQFTTSNGIIQLPNCKIFAYPKVFQQISDLEPFLLGQDVPVYLSVVLNSDHPHTHALTGNRDLSNVLWSEVGTLCELL